MHHADAIEWLAARDTLPGASVITSLPDAAELPGLERAQWRQWFADAAALVCKRVCDGGIAIFFQTDVELPDGWVDKPSLIAQGAAQSDMTLLYHGIVCRLAPGTPRLGRAGYSHLLAYGRPERLNAAKPIMDVLANAGFEPSHKSMGVRACAHACRLVQTRTNTRTVIDPFCGHGTVLAVANALGLDAIGVDLSKRMCQRARRLQIDPSQLE